MWDERGLHEADRAEGPAWPRLARALHERLRAGRVARILRTAVTWSTLRDGPEVRRFVVSAGWLSTAVGVVAAMVRQVAGDHADALTFAGLALFMAVFSVSTALAGRKLSSARLVLTYGVPAVAASCSVALLGMTARSGSEVVAAVSLVPAAVGTWLAVWWVCDLTVRGLAGADLAEATTTVRGAAAVWTVLVAVVVPAGLLSAAGWELSIDHGVVEGISPFFTVAAVFTYAGPGWSEYRRGIANASGRKPMV